jgi:uncharacterized membrane protein YjjP (DUF1212 family)
MTEPLTAQHVLDYLVELGSALMSAGCPTHRLEALLVTVAQLEGYTADIFAVPTGLFVTVRAPGGGPSAGTMVRVSEWTTDLERLVELDAVVNEVASRTLSIPEARQTIRGIALRGAVWSHPSQVLAAAGASAGAAISFGGGALDAALAGVGGALLQWVRVASLSKPSRKALDSFVGGLIAAMVAWVGTLLWRGASREVLVLAVIIPLLPGLTLTTGLSELSYRNLVSGTARLMHAAITLVSLVFGIVLVVELERWLGLRPETGLPRDPAAWPLQLAAVLVASASFGVILGLPRRRLMVALGSGLLVWVLTLVTHPLPPALAVFLTALVLAMAANLFAQLTQRPAQLFLMPGMLLLVPGALSFRSLEALLRGDSVAGAAQFGEVLVVAGALVMGLIVASVAAPANKAL